MERLTHVSKQILLVINVNGNWKKSLCNEVETIKEHAYLSDNCRRAGEIINYTIHGQYTAHCTKQFSTSLI